MNKIGKILLSSICLLVAGCAIEVDYFYTTILIFKNNSSHTISINNNNNDICTLECSINPGESYSTNGGGDMPWYPNFFTGDNCSVIFDNEIEIRHKMNHNPSHSICDEASYSIKMSGKHKTKTTYTYTFTDEDYDRAVAASANAD